MAAMGLFAFSRPWCIGSNGLSRAIFAQGANPIWAEDRWVPAAPLPSTQCLRFSTDHWAHRIWSRIPLLCEKTYAVEHFLHDSNLLRYTRACLTASVCVACGLSLTLCLCCALQCYQAIQYFIPVPANLCPFGKEVFEIKARSSLEMYSN